MQQGRTPITPEEARRTLSMILDELERHRMEKRTFEKADKRLHERVRLLTREKV